ncbi:hypothetical protein SPRG_02426 [Saprolegnia parasitica CBS 223.65]|uniref:Myb-like domain-containing protein n=1 Tax=Saprolegnia parasitica (strain CBS 223.65) TaxID=695850 RepID=A0A067CQH6_SAPPC|nr:hypothetical protein SPRG_02426 [Saprolegnia parasitica CBS 223.65]KDO32728.1 hypothetical protein SPRG_02426 [Saprolegnia parasitica CBS 223.65]|eukprot:XP_012196392.1 hypothetical protein SPRG_02426 [Saprolegnia parasitica CBS 223.65]
MGKKVFNPISPHFWSADEHARFLEALEKVGQCAPTPAVWGLIADHVGSRTDKDVQLHANRYFLQLQMLNTQKRKEMQAMQAVDAKWSREDDARFEELLAAHSSATCYNWEAVAAQLPNKTPRTVRDRYLKLVYDIAHIENGYHVTMHLGGAHEDRTPPGSSNAEPCAMYDCCTMLTPDEEDALMTALEETKIPPMATPPMLAVVAAAVVAMTNHVNRKPPTRETPKFSKDDAKHALLQALMMENADTGTVLNGLHRALRLHDMRYNDAPRNDTFVQKAEPYASNQHHPMDLDTFSVL